RTESRRVIIVVRRDIQFAVRPSSPHAERFSVTSPRPAAVLPSEFEHSALQDAFRRGVERGALTAAEVREACEAAEVKPRRLKEVLGALQAAEITVTELPARAVANASGRRGTTLTIDEGEKITSTTKTKTTGKKAASPAKKKSAANAAATTEEHSEATGQEESAQSAPATTKGATAKTSAKKSGGSKSKTSGSATKTAAKKAAKSGATKTTATKTTATKTAAAKSADTGSRREQAATTEVDPEGTTDEEAVAIAQEEDREHQEQKKEEQKAEAEEAGGFVFSDSDDDDAPAQKVVTAGATADPVKDYLKQIGKVALLNAAQEVELAKRIEAGLFAEDKLAKAEDIQGKYKRELKWIAQDGRRAKNHLLEANLRLVVSLA